jgi:hypothetical protein
VTRVAELEEENRRLREGGGKAALAQRTRGHPRE